MAVITRVVAGDLRSNTGANNRLNLNETGLNARTTTSSQVHCELKKREEPMTEEEEAAAQELTHLLEERTRVQI